VIFKPTKYRFPLSGPFLCCTILLLSLTCALSSEWKSTHLNLEERRSPNTIFCIKQDARGLIWIGTDQGLYRYDGKLLNRFIHDRRDKSSIADNLVLSMVEDNTGSLWFGSSRGTVSRLKAFEENFERYPIRLERSGNVDTLAITTLSFSDSIGLLAGTNTSGLFLLNADSVFQMTGPAEIKNLRAIYADSGKRVWLATQLRGLYRVDFSKQTTKTNIVNIPLPTTTCLLRIDDNSILAGTTKGIYKISEAVDSLQIEKPYLSDEIITGIIRSPAIGFEVDVDIWIATLKGLYALKSDLDGKQVFTYLPDKQIQSIASDRSGNVWAGIAQDGLYKLSRPGRHFETVYPTDELKNTSLEPIRSVFVHNSASKSVLWFGSMKKGLNGIDRQLRTVMQPLKHDESDSPTPLITDIDAFSDEELWVSSWGDGLFRIRYPEEETIAPLKPWESINYVKNLSSPVILDILPDTLSGQQVLWVGTEQGLDVLDANGEKIQSYHTNAKDIFTLSDNRIQSDCILRDRHGYLWVGTWHGLNRSTMPLDNKTGIQFQRLLADFDDANTIGDNRITALYEDRSDSNITVWVGTHGGGMNRIEVSDQSEIKVSHYTIQNGLPDNVVYAICSSPEGRLWISTNEGLCEFDPLTETARNYDELDGLPQTEFFWGAGYHDKVSGRLFFGSISGLIEFSDSRLDSEKPPDPVVITDFRVLNKPDSVNHILRNQFALARLTGNPLRLSSDQNSFSVEYALPDYRMPGRNQYAVQLEGFDESWSFSGERSFVSYTNLDPGSYRLRLRGKNSDGLWTQSETLLSIIIPPPFWKTWWFLTCAILVIAGSIALLVSSRVSQLLQVERLRTKLAADLHDDIGANLTEMAIMSEVLSMQKHVDDKTKSGLQRISKTSRDLIDSMSDIVWLVSPRRDSLHDLMLRLKDRNADLLANLDIAFKTENLGDLKTVSLPMEHRQHLFLIFKEALNNAVKYSKCRSISFTAKVDKKLIQMQLRDDGIGFAPGLESTGNGLTNMQQRASQIGGKVVLKSRPGSGTTVRFVGKIS